MAITLTLTKSGANAYVVKDFDENTITSGAVAGTSFTIQPPAGGWSYGWYRCYITGPTVDAAYGNSYGVSSFLIIPEDANFPTLPATLGKDRFGSYVPDGSGTPDAIALNTSTWPTGRALFDSPVEMITRACLGLGMGRLSTSAFVINPNHVTDEIEDNRLFMANVMKPYWLDVSKGGNVDPVRTRYQWLAKPGFFDGDCIIVPAWGIFFAKTPGATQSNISVEITTGSSSGYKVIVRSSGSTVETFDNLANNPAFETAINTGTLGVNGGNPSSYIRFYQENEGTSTTMHSSVDAGFNEVVVGSGAKAFGTTFRDYMISAVQTLYPLGVTRYEGPFNEPGASNTSTALFVTKFMESFHEAVKAGNASAVVMGPCTVNITDLNGVTGQGSNWKNFLDAGILNYIDELSFHSYSTIVNGDLNLARNTIETFLEFLAGYGADAMTMWQTEASHALLTVGGNPGPDDKGGVYMPRRARNAVYYWLIWDQYGVPFERNPQWYDYSHGFWPYPSFLFMALGSSMTPNPQVGLLATLARETFGKLYHHRVDFNSEPANHIFFGSVYGSAAAGSTMVLLSMSYIAGGTTVTITITGTTDPIVTVDGWGNETSKSQSSGRITVDVTDVPRYVRLPAGANATVYSVAPAGADWGTTPAPSVSAGKQSAAIGSGLNRPGLADDTYMTVYLGGDASKGVTFSDIEPPDNIDILFFGGDTPAVAGVVVTSGPHFQDMPGLLDFDVQTTADGGSTWATQKTVTRSVSSFRFGSDDSDAGCLVETYTREQWIDPVTFDSPVTCNGVRVHVRQLTLGGMPDALAANLNAWHGDATLTPQLVIQEVAVLSASSLSVPSDYPTTIAADSPSWWYRFNESSGATAVSEVNSPGCDGTYTGTVTYSQPGVIAGNSCFTNGSGAGVTVPDATQTRVGDTFTLECWVFLTYTGAIFRGLMNKGSGGYGFGTDTTRKLRLTGDANTDLIAPSTAAVPLNSWTHCVATKNGASVHLYLNGVDVTGTVTNHTCASGAGAPGTLFSGFAGGEQGDEAAVYPVALTASEVLAHFKAGAFPGAPSNQRAPKLEGTPVVGDQLRCLPGRWSPVANAYTFQWKSASTSGGSYSSITGATHSTYTLAAGESGKYVKCFVVGAAVGGSGSAVASNILGPVA